MNQNDANTTETSLDGNISIEKAISKYYRAQNQNTLTAVLEAIRQRMHEDGHFLVPVVPEADENASEENANFHLQYLHVNDANWIVAFTSVAEYEKGEKSATVSDFIDSILKQCVDDDADVAGVVINPWGQSMLVPKNLIQAIFDADKPENHIYFDVGDITQLDVDCIVNAANSTLLGGGGVDGAIHRAAGPKLLEECRKLGGCKAGQAKITSGWNLKAKYIIHTVGPVYKPGDKMVQDELYSCYYNSLNLAKDYDIHTIAFPAISTGAYGYPRKRACRIALNAVACWLDDHPDYGMAVVMSCYDQEMRDCYQRVINESKK